MLRGISLFSGTSRVRVVHAVGIHGSGVSGTYGWRPFRQRGTEKMEAAMELPPFSGGALDQEGVSFMSGLRPGIIGGKERRPDHCPNCEFPMSVHRTAPKFTPRGNRKSLLRGNRRSPLPGIRIRTRSRSGVNRSDVNRSGGDLPAAEKGVKEKRPVVKRGAFPCLRKAAGARRGEVIPPQAY
jgi:hypothetical protein